MTTILGSGHLSASSPGVMTGKATFAIRGTFDLVMDLPHDRDVNDHTYRIARLRCGRYECEVWWLNIANEGVEMAFWGQIVMEGYAMSVVVRPGDSGMNVEFLDCVQPLKPNLTWSTSDVAA